MNCAYDKEVLTGYYDGELDAAGKAEAERHIASCSECLRDLGEIKSAALLVRGLPPLRAPASIAEGVSRETGAAGGRVVAFSKARRPLAWATAVAAALLIAVNVVYFTRVAERPSPEVAKAPPAVAVVHRKVLAEPEGRRLRADEKAEAPDPAQARKESALEEPLTAKAPVRLQNELGREKDAAAPAAYTIASLDMARARPQVEAFLKKIATPVDRAVKLEKKMPEPEESVTVELTDAQLADLRSEVARAGSTVMVEGREENVKLLWAEAGKLDRPKATAGVKSKSAPSTAAPAAPAAGFDGDKDSEKQRAAPRRKIVIYFKDLAPPAAK